MANKAIDKTYLLQTLKDFYAKILKSEPAASGGMDKSLVTTGEKYIWNDKADLTDLAPAFDATTSYAAGDCVIYNNKMYRFTSPHSAGAWIGTDAVEVNFGEEIDAVKNTVNNFVITLTKSEYDGLSYAEKHDPTRVYYVTDYDSHMNYVELDDTSTAFDKCWSSQRVVNELNSHVYQLPIELTKDEYDALTPAQKEDPNKLYYVTDYDASMSFAELNDNEVAHDKVWSSYQITSVANTKVDKVSGKSLSSNDYTTTEKNKLAGIANNANNYVLPNATTAVKGGVIVGAGLGVSNGTIALGRTYATTFNASDQYMQLTGDPKLTSIVISDSTFLNRFLYRGGKITGVTFTGETIDTIAIPAYVEIANDLTSVRIYCLAWIKDHSSSTLIRRTGFLVGYTYMA